MSDSESEGVDNKPPTLGVRIYDEHVPVWCGTLLLPVCWHLTLDTDVLCVTAAGV